VPLTNPSNEIEIVKICVVMIRGTPSVISLVWFRARVISCAPAVSAIWSGAREAIHYFGFGGKSHDVALPAIETVCRDSVFPREIGYDGIGIDYGIDDALVSDFDDPATCDHGIDVIRGVIHVMAFHPSDLYVSLSRAIFDRRPQTAHQYIYRILCVGPFRLVRPQHPVCLQIGRMRNLEVGSSSNPEEYKRL